METKKLDVTKRYKTLKAIHYLAAVAIFLSGIYMSASVAELLNHAIPFRLKYISQNVNYHALQAYAQTPELLKLPPLPNIETEDISTTIDYRPSSNFRDWIVPYVFLQENIIVMAYHEGILWARQNQTGILLQSTNHGGNWAYIYKFENPVRAIYLNEHGVIFVSTTVDRWSPTPTGAIHRSYDGGETFHTVLSGMSGAAEHWNIASNDNIMFISEYGFKGRGDNARRIYRSIDWGITWQIVFDPGRIYNYHHHRILITDDGIVYQAIGDGINARIIRSQDNGASWQTVVTGYQPTSAIAFDTHILWGLDGGPYYGVMRYCRSTGAITRSFTTPEPFGSSNYDMLYVNGVVYAMFLSYGHIRYTHPGSIFFSRDEGITWELLGYIEKSHGWGIGLYSIVSDGTYAYVNISTLIYHDGIRERNFYGTLRFKLIS